MAEEPLANRILSLVGDVVQATGLSLKATMDEGPDGPRVNLEGADGELFLRRKGEALNALQQIANTIFRDELPAQQRVTIDCQGFRRDKETELRQMALFLAEKVVKSGVDQELGPLNAYERRIVHLAVSENAAVTTTSVGEPPMKKIVISVKRK
jgi:spoIIIJ-associated protein